jgi:hypothetical protein
MLEIPFLVAQGGRLVSGVAAVVERPEGAVEPEEEVVMGEPRLLAARSEGGQARLKPPFTESVGWPHWAQKGLRAFQSRSWRASA